MLSAGITAATLSETISFDAYIKLTHDLVNELVPRSGIYQNDNTFRYTRSNLERMNKVLQSMVLSQKLYNLLSGLRDDWIWVVISEPWCGDASWGTPALFIMAEATEQIEFHILLRDAHPEIMKAYQTEDTDSIPKLICLRKRDLKEIGTWGPRPQLLHAQVQQQREEPEFDYRSGVRAIHAWYEQDMTRSIQDELIECIKQWKELN